MIQCKTGLLIQWTVLLFLILALAQTTEAHVQQGEAAGFLTGLHHPISD
jgi:hydrogenase/urease accessory protein HupE